MTGTSQYNDEWVLQNDEASRDEKTSEDLSQNAELRISTDFHGDDRTVVDQNERPTIVSDEAHPISPLENHVAKNTKLESTAALSREDDVAPIPISQSSSCFVDDEITRTIKIAGHNKKTHHVVAVEDSNTNRVNLDTEILEQASASPSARGDRNVLHISAPNIQSTAALVRTSAGALSQLAPNDTPSNPGTADPSGTLSESPSRSAPHQNNFEMEGDEREEEVITIPEAFLVRETIEIPFADVVESVERADRAAMPSKKRRVYLLTLLVVALVAVSSGSALYVTLARNAPGTPEPSSALFEPSLEPSYYPSSHPSLMSVQEYIESNILQRNVKFDGMDALDPRKLALDWITKTDPLQLDVSDANLLQRYVLALLSYEYSEDNGLGWRSDNTECEWTGVACKYGNVIKLELASKKLTGGIPPEIGRLEYLEVLDMSSNSLSGTLPPELGNLSNLTKILLQYNDHLSGSIPPEIGGLQLLTTIDLGFNNFTGTLPAELGNASALTAILMMRNKITGPLPTEIGKLSVLEEIDVADNDLNGTIPRELGDLNGLTRIHLYSNSLSGSLPSEIGGLHSLKDIDMRSNSFFGTLPSELGHLKELTSLQIQGNAFNGTLPSELGNLVQLTRLDLTINKFTGSLPTDIGNLSNLLRLFAPSNKLTGTLPSEIGLLQNLQEFSVGINYLNGTLPGELGNLKYLFHLGLDNNRFTGTLPTELNELHRLTELRLNGNQFSGQFLSGLNTCKTGMKVLCVKSSNNFTGDTPEECDVLGYLCQDYTTL
ncbi:hypothetical protein ACHAW6_007085 [Cyclotella cf. meneghiniana]